MTSFSSKWCGALFTAVLSAHVLFGTGCVSQKPLPYATIPKNLSSRGPALTILPVEDNRETKDNMDKMLKLPEAVEEVLATEMEGIGMFQNVSRSTAASESDYTLAVALEQLRWEVPGYDRIVGTTLGISVATGGIGGLIYGSTGAEVLGHAILKMRLISGEKVILEKRYTGSATEKKAKMKSDTPATYREMAAKALASAIAQFKTDLAAIQRDGNTVATSGK